MDINLKIIVIPSIIAAATILTLLIIRAIAFRVFNRWARKAETKIDDIIVNILKTPSIYWSVAIGLYIGIAVSEFPHKYVIYLNKAIHVLIIFSITITIANIISKIFSYYVHKLNLQIPTTGLANGILKGTVIVIGVLIILNVLKISIIPLVTALGIGGFAVALAFQDTLVNLFAGIHILVEKSIRMGDFIKLETGQEGQVEHITWRTTRILTLSNNIVVIPNSKLAQSIVTNYFIREKKISLVIPVKVSYSSDPEKVESVLTDEAKKTVGEVQGLLGDPEPLVRFIPGFGESSLDFSLICHIREFNDQYSVQHELRKRIFKRFKQEGIEIPFPHRTVYLREEKEWQK